MKKNEGFAVVVDKELEDLVPVFLKNRHKEVDSLKVALAAADFEQLRQLGHRMKGVGTSYGFERVSAFGRQLEDGARSGNRAAIEATIREYTEYLARVEVTFQ
jgi:HPt (histidine-containing phosphotransfer) domain-containing protein